MPALPAFGFPGTRWPPPRVSIGVGAFQGCHPDCWLAYCDAPEQSPDRSIA